MLKSFLRNALEATSAAHPDDVLVARNALHSAGVNVVRNVSYPTTDLFAAIREFQVQNGLKVDGKVKPGGETEFNLKDYLHLTNLTRCLECGVLHGGVYSARYCSDCYDKHFR